MNPVTNVASIAPIYESKGEPAADIIEKGALYLESYLSSRYPFLFDKKDMQYIDFDTTKVCENPYDNITSSLSRYHPGFVLKFQYRDLLFPVFISKDGKWINCYLVDHDKTKEIPLKILEIALARLVKYFGKAISKDLSMTSKKCFFDLSTMQEDRESSRGAWGYAIDVKCLDKSVTINIAECTEGIYLRIEENKPARSNKRKNSDSEITNSLRESSNDDEQVPSQKGVVEVLYDTNIISDNIKNIVKNKFYELLMLRYPCKEIKNEEIHLGEVKWSHRLPHPSFYMMEGYKLNFNYFDEKFETYSTKDGSRIFAKDFEGLHPMPQEVYEALSKKAQVAYGIAATEIAVIKSEAFLYRNSTSPSSPLSQGYFITYCHKNDQEKKHELALRFKLKNVKVLNHN